MTHEERIALIYHPYFITNFTTCYPHSGCNIGDQSGGDRTDDNYIIVAGKRIWLEAPRTVDGDLHEAKRLIDGRVTKFNVADIEADNDNQEKT